VIPWGEALTKLVDIGGHDLNLVDIEEQLRGTLIKLLAHRKKLEPLPENCTYTLAMKLKDEASSYQGVGSLLADTGARACDQADKLIGFAMVALVALARHHKE
jgi:hypothetical protein